jgi:hypothetical protein
MKQPFLYLICPFLILFLLCSSISSEAQTQPFEQGQVFQQQEMATALSGDPGDPYCDPLCNCRKDGSICPIDDGLVALLAAGALFGIVQIRRSRAALP